MTFIRDNQDSNGKSDASRAKCDPTPRAAHGGPSHLSQSQVWIGTKRIKWESANSVGPRRTRTTYLRVKTRPLLCLRTSGRSRSVWVYQMRRMHAYQVPTAKGYLRAKHKRQ